MRPNRFSSLDGLRGVCALTVLALHCNNFFHKGPVFQHGYLAVDVFFILSGFVIALTYENELKSGLPARIFLIRRAQRLLPTYWIAAIINFVVFAGIVQAGLYVTHYTATMLWIVVPFSAALMLPEFVTPEGAIYPTMLNVTWSLFAEWVAYFAYCRGLFRLSTKSLAFIVAIGWAAMLIAANRSGTGWLVGDTRDSVLGLSILRCIPSFLAGVVIYRLHTRALFKRLPVVATEWILTGWIAVAALPTFTATPNLDAIVVVVVAPLLICLLIRSDSGAPGFCRVLGDLSYPLYVVHPGIILIAISTPVFQVNRGPNPMGGIFVVIASIMLAIVVNRLAGIARGVVEPATTEVAPAWRT
jgi:peptidoglycan/LPS O-acetylase OafA/YrhL